MVLTNSDEPEDHSNLQVERSRKKKDAGVSSMKHMNTHATMLLYLCIMTVLLCCCLGRCLIVPLSQASRYELNSRKHIRKLDKNAFIQKEVVV